MNTPKVQRLSEKEKTRFDQYMSLFVNYFPTKEFYQKNNYDSEFYQPKRKDKKTPLCLFEKLKISTVERHLDKDLWWQWQNANNSHCLPRNPNWLALNAPRMIHLDAIDLDAKDQIVGYYSETTKNYNKMPVVFLRLAFFKKIKLIYDHFPNRIWCISSESLGLHIWKRHPILMKTEQVQHQMKCALNEIGLGSIEVHPMFGRAFRRPFGVDYRTITENGVITKWQDQLDYFIQSGKTPSFKRIVIELIRAMQNQVLIWIKSKYKYHNENKKLIPQTVHQIHNEILTIISWLRNGCPAIQESPIQQSHDNSIIELSNKTDWYHRLVNYAANGLPSDDSIGQVLFEITKWLYWVELYEIPHKERMDQINVILKEYIIKKNNGYVTRLNNGNEKLVFDQIKRIIKSASKIHLQESILLFERIRHKIKNKMYKLNICISDLLKGKKSSSFRQLNMCMPPQKTVSDGLLPEVIEEKIKQKQGMKKLFPFANILLNKVVSCGGKARVGRKWFASKGFKDPNKTQERIEVLIEAGVLHRGSSYSVGRFAIEYSIPPKILELFKK